MAFKHVIEMRHMLEHTLLPHEIRCLQQAWKSHLKVKTSFFFSSVEELPA